MDENSVLIEQILREDELEHRGLRRTYREDADWQTVSYRKKTSKHSNSESFLPDRRPNGGAVLSDVFREVEEHSADRRRRMQEAQVDTTAVIRDGLNRHSDEDDDSDAEVTAADVEVKKVKQKKPKKPKVTVGEAAARIDAGDLGAFFVDITVSVNFHFFLTI